MVKVITFGGVNTSANPVARMIVKIVKKTLIAEMSFTRLRVKGTSDEEDTEFLQLALESAYGCLPQKASALFISATR